MTRPALTVLHTADWHLGRQLFGRQRHAEFDAFLSWLLAQIQETQADVLLIAGDIFDTVTPPNRAQSQYYQFLAKAAGTSLSHIIITAGNHDSAAFLDAPKALLQALNVQVIGQAGAPEEQVLLLKNRDSRPQAVICAVPYLRDRDVRTAEAGETSLEKAEKMLAGITAHYLAAGETAEQLRAEEDIPVIGMGHLFAAGGKTAEGDGVRDITVGTLGHVSAAVFPPSMDYVALGHLHVPQTVGGHAHIRYSGSPIAMGFGEAGQQKQILRIDFTGRQIAEITALPVPEFQPLRKIAGDMDALEKAIATLKDTPSWIEADYTGQAPAAGLRQRLEQAAEGGRCSLLRIKNSSAYQKALHAPKDVQTLQQMTPQDVFAQLLAQHELPNNSARELTAAFNELLEEVRHEN